MAYFTGPGADPEDQKASITAARTSIVAAPPSKITASRALRRSAANRVRLPGARSAWPSSRPAAPLIAIAVSSKGA